MTIFHFVNREEIPKDLPPGQYTTQVISASGFQSGQLVIELKYIGEEYDSKNPQCLFPLTKTVED